MLKEFIHVNSTRSKVHVVVNIHYHENAHARAEVFEMFLAHGNAKFFFHANVHGSGSCPVVSDVPGLNGTITVDLGTLSGLPPGNYVLIIQHGVLDPCFAATPGCDTSAANWVIVEHGQLTVCD